MVFFAMAVIIGVPMVAQILMGVFDAHGISRWGWSMYTR